MAESNKQGTDLQATKKTVILQHYQIINRSELHNNRLNQRSKSQSKVQKLELHPKLHRQEYNAVNKTM